MKNIKKSCYLVPFLLVFGILSANAHEMSKSFLQGRWIIKRSSVPGPARVRFHAGHNHSQPSSLVVFNLCADKNARIYGRVTNNLSEAHVKNLKVDSVSLEGHVFDMVLVPLKSSISSDPMPVKFLHESSMGNKTIKVSFDGGLNYYTATRKNRVPTSLCLQHMRNQKRKERRNK